MTMTIKVVKNSAGQVIASYEPGAAGGPQLAPVLPAGHTLEDMVVDSSYKSNLSLLYAAKAA